MSSVEYFDEVDIAHLQREMVNGCKLSGITLAILQLIQCLEEPMEIEGRSAVELALGELGCAPGNG